jgi:hypothetical protein
VRLLMIRAAISIFVISVCVSVCTLVFHTLWLRKHYGCANLDIGLLTIEKIFFVAHEAKILYSSRLRAITGL